MKDYFDLKSIFNKNWFYAVKLFENVSWIDVFIKYNYIVCEQKANNENIVAKSINWEGKREKEWEKIKWSHWLVQKVVIWK